MLTYDHRDFRSSALSLAGGMFGVALLAAWRSRGDIPTISLTLGLPFGVLAFWALYSIRMKKLTEDLGFLEEIAKMSKQPLEKTHSDRIYPNLSYPASHLLNESIQTLEASRSLPRFRVKSRPRVDGLTKETTDTSLTYDQWHM